MNLEILRELGEWAALGFYEAEEEGLPWPMNYGRALRRLYENMEVDVPEGRRLIPCEPFYRCRNMETDGLNHPAGLILDFHKSFGFKVNDLMAGEKKKAFPHYAAFIDALYGDLSRRLVHYGGFTHSNPDIRRVVDEGFLAMDGELDAEMAAVRAGGDAANTGELDLLRALKDYALGVRAHHGKAVRALEAAAAGAVGGRKEELEALHHAFSRGFMHKSETFLQGILAVNFTWMLDGCDSIGRFDQVLGPLFEADVAAGRLDLAFARELLDELWQNFERLNGWNLQLGGYTPDGRDGVNALTLECLAACARNRLRRPNVSFRITGSTPGSALVEALKALANGAGRPALYNDEGYIKSLLTMDLGLMEEDAREMGFGGCTETMIAGMSNVGSLEGPSKPRGINLAKALELAVFDGFDPVTGRQAGPHTGLLADMPDFDAFMTALKRQIQYQTDAFVAQNRLDLEKRFTAGDPKLNRTFFTRDCVRNRKSFEAGGARYNWAVVSYQGIANTIDGAAAVAKTVFQDKTVSAVDLLAALEANFEGHGDTWRALKAAPKFGNDDAGVDEIGRDLLQFAWGELGRHETPRGGRYMASCILFATYLKAGRQVGATPDGRRKFEALVDSVGPVAGRDRKGPTAVLNSVSRLPLELAPGTPVLNLRFQKDIFTHQEPLEKLAAMIRTFFLQGGLQVQISVLDGEMLRAALESPREYSDLIVRIGGYSEYFNRLDRKLQETVIRRTEYGFS